MNILKHLLLVVVMLFPLHLLAFNNVTLMLKDGKAVTFFFSSKPVLVPGDQLTISTDSETVTYDYADVQRIYWSTDSIPKGPTGISAITEENGSHVVFRVLSGSLEASGLAKGERVMLYTTGGALVASAQASDDGTASLPLDYGKGVYIVRASSGISYKFMKR